MPSTATTAAPPLTPRDARLAPWRAFVRAQAHVSRRLDEDLRAEHGLSLQEYVALLILAEAPERRLRMGRLADSLTLSKSGRLESNPQYTTPGWSVATVAKPIGKM